MARRIMLIPVGSSAGLTSVSLGMVRAMQQQGLKVNFFKPMGQPRHGDDEPEKSTTIITQLGPSKPATPFTSAYVAACPRSNIFNESYKVTPIWAGS